MQSSNASPLQASWLASSTGYASCRRLPVLWNKKIPWVQIDDGSVEHIQLSQDLTHAVSHPVTLFHASDCPWVKAFRQGKYVTDGPFVYQDAKQGLSLLWSSFSENGYAIGIAHSLSGNLHGPWIHETQPIYDQEGGHAMLFETLDGRRMISFHSPNSAPLERAVFQEWR